MDWTAIGARARELREKEGLSQEELALRMRALGHTTFLQEAVSKVESGDRKLNLLEAHSWAEACGRGPQAFMFDRDAE